MIFILALSGCGQKSVITPIAEPQKLVEQFGDGEHIEYTLRFPLTENSIDAYEDVTRSDDPIFGGFLSSFKSAFYNMGASLGLGKKLIQIQQVIPEIDTEFVTDIRISKIFFTLDDKICDKPDIDFENHPICKHVKKKNFWRSLFNFRKKDQDFAFVKNTVLHITPSDKMPSEDTIVNFPSLDFKNYKNILAKAFPNLFDDEIRNRRRDRKKEKDDSDLNKEEITTVAQTLEMDEKKVEHVVVKSPEGLSYEIGKFYRGKKKNDIVVGNNISDTIVLYTNNSFHLKKYFNEREDYNKLIQDMVSIKGMLFVTLKRPTQDVNYFKGKVNYDTELEQNNVSVSRIDTCGISDCISLKLNNFNLVPLFKNKKSVFVDAYLDVDDIPEQVFQLKGYIEFKIKIKMDF
jgi:hypothetical protein